MVGDEIQRRRRKVVALVGITKAFMVFQDFEEDEELRCEMMKSAGKGEREEERREAIDSEWRVRRYHGTCLLTYIGKYQLAIPACPCLLGPPASCRPLLWPQQK